jgi:hypothetical protein
MKSLQNCEKHFHDQSFNVRGLQALISGNELNSMLGSNSQEIYFLLYLICE